jgi:hypothetical protein
MARIRPKEECYRLAREMGVEIDEGCGDAWAPKGYVFSGSGTHSVVFEANDVFGRIGLDWWGLLKDLRAGLEKCDDPECEYCHDQEGEE